MNGNFVLAGALGSNPVLIVLGALLMVAWRNAGWIGLDRWLIPLTQGAGPVPATAERDDRADRPGLTSWSARRLQGRCKRPATNR